MASETEIHAVVEVGSRREGLWVQLPAEPWPPFVRLWCFTPPEEVARVVGVVSSYGRADRGAVASVSEVLADFPRILPGGLAVIIEPRAQHDIDEALGWYHQRDQRLVSRMLAELDIVFELRQRRNRSNESVSPR